MNLSFKGRAKRLDDIDLPKLGYVLGVGEDEIHAFIDAETRGYGFDAQGRPLILFEPHVFYRNLSGAKRNEAVKQGIAYRSWGAKPYPKDSYPRLKAAIAIDETAALKSASWGLGQVLGENHKLAGYDDVHAFVEAMLDDEENHLKASVNFILNTKLDDELRRRDWEGFARGYNGPGYKRNGYHTKLAEAFAKWSRIKDTPWKPGLEAANDNRPSVVPPALRVPVHVSPDGPLSGPVPDTPGAEAGSAPASVGFLDVLASIFARLFGRK